MARHPELLQVLMAADDLLLPAGTYPAPVLAAAILTAEGVSFLLVGSAAL